MLVFDIKTKKLLHYDSIKNTERHNQLERKITDLISILEQATNQKLNLCLIIGNSPQQNDFSSCGVYTCYSAHKIAKNQSLDYTVTQVKQYRLKMAQNLSLNY